MAEVRWAGQAVEQVGQIVSYIGQFDRAAAGRFGTRLIALGESLRVFPRRGRPTPSGARELTGVPPYVLRYVVVGDVVTILTVRHGRQRPR